MSASRIKWRRSDYTDPDLLQAKIYLPAAGADKHPIHAFTLNAREHSWDVQTADRKVLAHDSCPNRAVGKIYARAALSAALRELNDLLGP